MTIPLNIDTLTGLPFSVNHTIDVDSTGRISVEVTNAPTIQETSTGVLLKAMDSKREIRINIPTNEIRKLAYTLLGISEAIHNREKQS